MLRPVTQAKPLSGPVAKAHIASKGEAIDFIE
jgi:hypothetical protein